MAAGFSRYSSGPQYSGYAALVFWEFANWGKNNETNKGLLISLEKIYSHIRAKLPELYGVSDNRTDELTGKTGEVPTEKEKTFLKMREKLISLGDPKVGEFQKARGILHCLEYDGVKACTQKEEEYLGILFGIYENLDEITAVSKIIDTEKMPAAAPPMETS